MAWSDRYSQEEGKEEEEEDIMVVDSAVRTAQLQKLKQQMRQFLSL